MMLIILDRAERNDSIRISFAHQSINLLTLGDSMRDFLQRSGSYINYFTNNRTSFIQLAVV
jgi:hypothetical protein